MHFLLSKYFVSLMQQVHSTTVNKHICLVCCQFFILPRTVILCNYCSTCTHLVTVAKMKNIDHILAFSKHKIGMRINLSKTDIYQANSKFRISEKFMDFKRIGRAKKIECV